MSVEVDMKALFEAGVHFGHKTSRWHPKMAPYIHSKRQDSHIIDLAKTVEALDKALPFITKTVASGKKVLFVAEKRAALDVVLTHIKKLGLDSFCLPIHNVNIKKKEILNDLGNTLSLGAKTQIINPIQEINAINLAEQKRKILNILSSLHAKKEKLRP